VLDNIGKFARTQAVPRKFITNSQAGKTLGRCLPRTSLAQAGQSAFGDALRAGHRLRHRGPPRRQNNFRGRDPRPGAAEPGYPRCRTATCP
jgi:hypothetical protein